MESWPQPVKTHGLPASASAASSSEAAGSPQGSLLRSGTVNTCLLERWCGATRPTDGCSHNHRTEPSSDGSPLNLTAPRRRLPPAGRPCAAPHPSLARRRPPPISPMGRINPPPPPDNHRRGRRRTERRRSVEAGHPQPIHPLARRLPQRTPTTRCDDPPPNPPPHPPRRHPGRHLPPPPPGQSLPSTTPEPSTGRTRPRPHPRPTTRTGRVHRLRASAQSRRRLATLTGHVPQVWLFQRSSQRQP